jgi:hypothetical protein
MHEIPPREYLQGKLQQNAGVVTSGSIVGCYFSDRTQIQWVPLWSFIVSLIYVQDKVLHSVPRVAVTKDESSVLKQFTAH